MPACSHEKPRGSAHSSGAQPVGSRALPYWMPPTRALSLESANARGPAKDAVMAMASDATSILRMDFCRFSTKRTLFVEHRSGWIVGTVDVGVAGQAGATDQPLVRGGPAGESHPGQQVVGMTRHGVALLAQHRRRQREQRLLAGAVRVVASQAVLAYRRMFEQERPALLGMARVAGLVHGIGLDEIRGERPVRVVAIHARHLSFRQ